MFSWDACCQELLGDEDTNIYFKINLYTSMKFLKDNVKNKNDFDRIIEEFNQLTNTRVKMINKVITFIKSKPESTEHENILHINANINSTKQDLNYHRNKFKKNITKVFTALK
jgi:hypothetical protein